MRRVQELSGFKTDVADGEEWDTLHLRFAIEKMIAPLADGAPTGLDGEFGGNESYLHMPVGGDEYLIIIRKNFTAAELAEIAGEAE